MRGSHLRWKVVYKCLDVCERGQVLQRNKNGPLPPLLSCELSVSVKDRHDRKKNKYKIEVHAAFEILTFSCTFLLCMKTLLVLKTIAAEAATRGVPCVPEVHLFLSLKTCLVLFLVSSWNYNTNYISYYRTIVRMIVQWFH